MASCAWTRLGPAPASGAGAGEGGGAPAARSSHGVSSAGEGSGALVVFGGEADARVPLGSDAWVLRGAARPAEGCAWEVVRAGAEAPPARVGHAQATVGDAAYIFGGRNAIAVGEGGLNDLYAFRSAEGGRWEKLERAQAPAPRSYHTMAAAEGASTLYSFGGCGEGGRLADLHALDVREPCWRAMKSSPLRGRGGASLFASADGTSVMVVAGFAGEETRDIALFDVRKAAWHEVDASAWLCKRSVVAHFRDQRGRAILFGGEVDPSSKGHNGAGSFANDVLALVRGEACRLCAPCLSRLACARSQASARAHGACSCADDCGPSRRAARRDSTASRSSSCSAGAPTRPPPSRADGAQWRWLRRTSA